MQQAELSLEFLGEKEDSCKNRIKTIDFLTYLVKKQKILSLSRKWRAAYVFVRELRP